MNVIAIFLQKAITQGIPLLFGAARSEAGMLMDPQGLCLMEVEY